ncbi:hypothetical protein F4677DRAFT_403896 [Hypoxylon crocopeplum]|nr:hypothetical protein F4677DRAFT_403896 [Hypoxylon crocopeplum]
MQSPILVKFTIATENTTMTNISTELACINIGNGTELSGNGTQFQCCETTKPDSPACQSAFPDRDGMLDKGCSHSFLTKDVDGCIAGCQNLPLLYGSYFQIGDLSASGSGPKERFAACVNVPAIAKAMKANASGASTGSGDQGADLISLPENFMAKAEEYIEGDFTDDGLKNVTSAVTECLSSTCRVSRCPTSCYSKCSPVALLANNTTPNVTAISDCVSTLCGNGYNSLPHADPDITGIGVWISYVVQCLFIIGLLLTSLISASLSRRKKLTRTKHKLRPPRQPEEQAPEHPTNEPGEEWGMIPAISSHLKDEGTNSLWYILLEEFHKAQCFFAATLMIASLSENIFERDMLQVFLIMPISLNGVLPVVFAYFLLVTHSDHNHGPPGFGLTVLTVGVYALSSFVYWSMYAQFLPYSTNGYTPEIWAALSSSLASIPQCGGDRHSAFALCPNLHAFQSGIGDVENSGDKLLGMTPIIWAFSTVGLLVLLVPQFQNYYRRRRSLQRRVEMRGHSSHAAAAASAASAASPYFRPPWTARQTTKEGASRESREIPGSIFPHTFFEVIYIVATLAFLAGMAMQVSLLSISWTLHMMDPRQWSFGQVVAITVWIPPVVELLYASEQWKRESREQKANQTASSPMP